MKKTNILKTADEITSRARNKAYGSPAANHGATAALYATYLERRHGVALPLDARDVCMLNILQKVSRDANAPGVDNLVDIAGYARNAQMIEQKEG